MASEWFVILDYHGQGNEVLLKTKKKEEAERFTKQLISKFKKMRKWDFMTFKCWDLNPATFREIWVEKQLPRERINCIYMEEK